MCIQYVCTGSQAHKDIIDIILNHSWLHICGQQISVDPFFYKNGIKTVTVTVRSRKRAEIRKQNIVTSGSPMSYAVKQMNLLKYVFNADVYMSK